MKWSPDVLPLAILLALSAAGPFIAALVPNAGLARRVLAACFALAAGLAVWLAFQTVSTPLDWNAGTWLAIPGRVAWQADWSWRAEPLRLWWVAALLGVAGLSLIGSQRQSLANNSRPPLVAAAIAHAACIAQWLAAELWLALLLHAVTGAAAFIALGTGSGRPTAGPAARKWLVTGLIGDAFLLTAVVLLSPLLQPGSPWNSVATFAQLAERSPLLPGVAAVSLVLGALPRAVLWPFNDWLHEATEGPSPESTRLIATAIWPSGLYWLATAGPWLTQTPAAQLLAAGLGLLTAVVSPFFALSQPGPRRIAGWLLASHSGLLVAALALVPECAGPSGLVGLAAMCAAAFLWQRGEDPEARAAPPLRLARESTTGNRLVALALFGIALCPAATFTTGPLLLHVALQSMNQASPATAADPGHSSPDASPAPVLPGIAVAAALGLTLALQGAAAMLLVRRSMAGRRGDATPALSTLLAPIAVPPLAWLLLPAATAGGGLAGAVSAGSLAATALLGAGAALLLTPLATRMGAGWDSLARLSRQRLHVDGAVFLLVNVPVRGLAQLARFCEWFVLDNLLYGQLARLPLRAGCELRRLQTGQATFYALVAILVTGALLVTLLQVRP